MKNNFFLQALVSLLGLLAPAELHSQDLGNVGLRTVEATLASGVTCTGSPQLFATSNPALNAVGFRNLGQTAHQVSAVSTAASFTVEIDGVDTNGIAVRISNPVVTFNNGATVSYVAQGAGFYPNIQVQVTCTASATFSLSYTGSFGSNGSITGATAGSVFVGNANQVQGVVQQQTTAAPVFPIINGGLQPPVNLGFTATGLDTFRASAGQIAFGSAGAQTVLAGLAPAPSTTNETGIAVELSSPDASGQGSTFNAPWVCLLNQAQGCNNTGDLHIFSATNVTAGLALQRIFTNPSFTQEELAIFVDFAGTATAARQQIAPQASPVAFASNTLAGSTILVATECTSAGPCVIGSVTDTQSVTYKQLAVVNASGTIQVSAGISLWMNTTPTSAAADTITVTASSGVLSKVQIMELTGITTAPLTYLAVSQSLDTVGATLTRPDATAGNQFNCTVTMSTKTTTTCQTAPSTINGVPVRLYVTDFQINTAAAGGTTTTLQLQTGTGSNCATATAALSAITYPNNTAGLTSILGMRTPLIAPLQSAVCVIQAGTTANTSVVEIHGFIAP